jgi:hypothetical protein
MYISGPAILSEYFPTRLPITQFQFLRFKVFTAVIMKNVIFWDMALCSSCVNRRFGGMYRLHLQGRKIRYRVTSVSRCLQTAVPPKCRFTQNLHGATYQKTAFFKSHFIQVDVSPCSLVDWYWRFRGTCYLHRHVGIMWQSEASLQVTTMYDLRFSQRWISKSRPAGTWRHVIW